MSGGLLVVMDRSGRDVKRYPLPTGMATLGADHSCDIRVLQPQVEPHHATVVVHAAQSVVRNVGAGETLVNGRAVSVAALRHRDVIAVGGRALRWEYSAPRPHHAAQHAGSLSLVPVPTRGGRRGGGGAGGAGAGARGARRGSGGAGGAPRDRALQLALELNHRASMPGSTGGKQVAIVQPQRRDTSEQTDKNQRASPLVATRRTKTDLNSSISSETDSENSKRKSNNRSSPKNLQNTTKATLWIESRKSSPRRRPASPLVVQHARKAVSAKKTTPLRLTVLKKAQSAQKVIKIEAPLKIDYTKQAAIMLMTGHTPKSKLSTSPHNQSKSKKSPSFVVKKQSPVRKTPRASTSQSVRGSRRTGSTIGVTPSRGSTFAQDSSNRRSSKRNSGNKSVTILEITDSTQNSTVRASSISTRSRKSSFRSPSLPTPKKSAMKDLSKKNTRKTESITFDLSNLDNYQDTTDARTVSTDRTYCSESEEDLTLHYSESSNQSPSPRKSINSRSSRMSERVETSVTTSASRSSLPARATRTLTPESPRARKSIRGSASVQKTLVTSPTSDNTKSDLTGNTTVASAFRTRTLSPRNNLESYSVVDLVSLDSINSKSIYNSAGSIDTTDYGTPTSFSARKTRSTINPTLLGSSTPYVGRTRATRSKSSSSANKSTRSSVSTRRSKSLSTPENKHISVNSTRVSRASRSRSRINDSDLMLLDDTEVEDSSPKTSKRNRTTKSVTNDTSVNMTAHSPDGQGPSTPENRHSPVEEGTPVLNIQSLLESSMSSETSQNSGRRGTRSAAAKRKTIGVLSEPKRRRDNKSKSLGASVKKTWLRLSRDSGASSDKTDEGALQPDNEEVVTPKSAVKISPEAVKNKHSSAKKPQSKRSIIDNLNNSDHVKKLFNSPVKRKLSQSMTEFSRKQLFEDDDDIQQVRRPTRNTVALTGRTPNNSILDETEAITPERFVSPIGSPDNSPNLSGIKRLFKKGTPENDLREVRGVRSLMRTPHPRKSIKNDLTNVDAVKNLFARSPRNRLSDVRVKEVFAASPNNDLRRVGGVKSLFQNSPKNDLTDVRGVRKMFQKKSPENDLRNVSGVKKTLRNSPKNDLTDVRGVRKLFKGRKQTENYHDVSGVEELFNDSNQSANKSEVLFDMLVGKPVIKSVYSKTFSTKSIQKPKTRKLKSLHSSIDIITNNVEEWLEKELQKRLHDKSSVTRQLKLLATDTVEGTEPIRESRTRNSSMVKKSASEIYDAHMLPIKKRSLAEVSLNKKTVHLPIKKRAVVHSTPVKGRTNMTMNASELGRVSPIAAVDSTREVEQNISNTRSTQIITDDKEAPQPVKARTPRKQQTPKKIDISKPSPNKSPVKDIAPKRLTRNRKNTTNTSINTKKNRQSIVITKKPPVMSPQPKPAPKTAKQVAKEVSSVASPKKTRATRGKKEVSTLSIESPRRTKARTTKAIVVITRMTPKLKPQPKAKPSPKNPKPNKNLAKTPEKETQAKKTRKVAVVEAKASPKISPKRKTRGSKPQAAEIEKPVPARKGRKAVEIEEPVQPKKGRKANTVDTKVQENAKGRGRKNVTFADSNTNDKQTRSRNKSESETSIQPAAATRGRGRSAKAIVEQKETSTRTNKTRAKSQEIQPKTRAKSQEIQPKTRAKSQEIQPKTRAKSQEPKTKAKSQIQPKTRGKKVDLQTSVESEPEIRSRRTKAAETVVPETKGRKRKADAIKEVPAKITKTEPKRGKNADPVASVETNTASKKKVESVREPAKKTTRETRAKKVEEEKKPVKESKPAKGRKAVEPKESVTTVAAASRGKRKAIKEPSPAKAAKKAATQKAAAPSPPAKTRGRSTRNKTQTEVTSQAVGRSRRR